MFGARGDGHIRMPREPQHLVHEARAPTGLLVSRRDADDLHVRPAEEHRERAHVVGITTDVGVEMHQHDASVSVASSPCSRSRCRSGSTRTRLRNVALGTMIGLAVIAFLVAWLVKKVVTKLLLVVLLVGAGFTIYNQREELGTLRERL